MCGIMGVVNTALSESALHDLAVLMANQQKHRGPDDAGVWVDAESSIAMAHRRLAIHDLSPLGAQPMFSNSGNLIIVFNGEIYNFNVIKQKLKLEGCVFKGSSDTEVLINAIEYWGLESTIQQCIGMFAFAVFDKNKNTLTLVRDRIGEKPLYYGVVGGNFLFSSELKGIIATSDYERPPIDHTALASFLKYGYVSAPRTIYQNVKKLEPGCFIVLDLNNTIEKHIDINPHQYWSLDTLIAQKEKIESPEPAIQQLDLILNHVIDEQALSDVPLGAFLSGGIDSSVVASILQAQKHNPIDTFTIGFYEKSFNEAEHAKAIAQHIGSRHHELYVDAKDALAIVPSLSYIYDEPFSDASQIPMLIVSKLARQQVTVCLSGDGGDELFCGYNRYAQTQLLRAKASKVPVPIKKSLCSLIESLSPNTLDSVYSIAQRALRRKGGANFGVKLHKLAKIVNMETYANAYDYLCSYWANPEMLMSVSFSNQILGTSQNFEKSFLDSAMEWDQKWYLPGDNLAKTDRASMAASLELRVPLLDLRVLEFSWNISNSLKLKNNETKWLLKQVLYKYVPQKLIERPKMGFSIPIGDWLRNELREWAETLMDQKFLMEQGLFQSDVIRSVWNEHMLGMHDHSNKLWTFFIFQDWYLTQYKRRS